MLKRIVAIIIMCLLSLGIILSTRQYKRDLLVEQNKQEAEKEQVDVKEKTFDIWYQYSAYEEYLKYVAEEFEKETGVKVNLVCKDDLEYAAIINSNSVAGNGPDLYIASTTMLENLYLSGIISLADTSIVNSDNYANIAIDSVSYSDKICGYPLGYDVSVLAYNANYINVEPTSFEEIKSYVGAEENGIIDLEGISKMFDMESKDILYNYGFLGSYISASKDFKTGKLISSFNSEKAKAAAVEYLALKEYFGLSNDSRAYSSVVSDFATGKTLFAILNTSVVGDSRFASLNYNVIPVPDYNSDLSVTSMSYTEMIIVNPYSDSMEDALKFAKMSSFDYADKMHEKCGIMSAKKGIDYGNVIADKFYVAYESSVPLPKYMETEDFVLLVGNAINHIWKGEDSSEVLDALQNTYDMKND